MKVCKKQCLLVFTLKYKCLLCTVLWHLLLCNNSSISPPHLGNIFCMTFFLIDFFIVGFFLWNFFRCIFFPLCWTFYQLALFMLNFCFCFRTHDMSDEIKVRSKITPSVFMRSRICSYYVKWLPAPNTSCNQKHSYQHTSWQQLQLLLVWWQELGGHLRELAQCLCIPDWRK